MLNAFRAQRGMTPLSANKADQLFDTALIHVEVQVLGRGSPGDMAIVYALSAGDRETWIKALEDGRVNHAGDIRDIQRVSLVASRNDW